MQKTKREMCELVHAGIEEFSAEIELNQSPRHTETDHYRTARYLHVQN